MAWLSARLGGLVAIAFVGGLVGACSPMPPAPEVGRFVGTTPAGVEIRSLLGISDDASSEIIEWDLALHPDRYVLRLAHGATTANRPGLGPDAVEVERAGTWTESTGDEGRVFRLAGAVDLREVGPDILAVLNADSSLMIGDGGWSYTLNRADRSERPVDPRLIPPDMSYPISPAASGPTVFGVFEGRTPCQGIAADLGVDVYPACAKAKWRVTLFQEAGSAGPAGYVLEGTLFIAGRREGRWSRASGSSHDADAVVYRLEPAGDGEALRLLVGDDNVLFFLDRELKPLVGTAEYSYTLNRHGGPPPPR